MTLHFDLKSVEYLFEFACKKADLNRSTQISESYEFGHPIKDHIFYYCQTDNATVQYLRGNQKEIILPTNRHKWGNCSAIWPVHSFATLSYFDWIIFQKDPLLLILKQATTSTPDIHMRKQISSGRSHKFGELSNLCTNRKWYYDKHGELMSYLNLRNGSSCPLCLS